MNSPWERTTSATNVINKKGVYRLETYIRQEIVTIRFI